MRIYNVALSEKQIITIIFVLKHNYDADDLAQIAFEVDLIDTLEEMLENDFSLRDGINDKRN
jgi:hypothetical protein